MKRWMLLVALTLLLTACAGQTFTPELAPTYRVLRRNAEFYRFGPLQPGPADARLPMDSTVLMLRREFGFSLVQLPDGAAGYVANDDLMLSPPEPVEFSVTTQETIQPRPRPAPPPLPPDFDLPVEDLPQWDVQ